jgi:hypothetical protein
MRIAYRTRQFWNALTATPAAADLQQAYLILSPGQRRLFEQLSAGEQVHALRVLRKIQHATHFQPELADEHLFQAALLHDVGKTRIRLTVWERILIVLANRLVPGQVLRWGHNSPVGWRRAFVVAQQHPVWGADLADTCGSAPLTVQLIRRHQEPLPRPPQSREDKLLALLQSADETS